MDRRIKQYVTKKVYSRFREVKSLFKYQPYRPTISSPLITPPLGSRHTTSVYTSIGEPPPPYTVRAQACDVIYRPADAAVPLLSTKTRPLHTSSIRSKSALRSVKRNNSYRRSKRRPVTPKVHCFQQHNSNDLSKSISIKNTTNQYSSAILCASKDNVFNNIVDIELNPLDAFAAEPANEHYNIQEPGGNHLYLYSSST